MTTLVNTVYGTLVPPVPYHGQISEDDVDGKEPLSLYVMSRVNGIGHLGFLLAHDLPNNSPEYFTRRANFDF